MRQRAWPVLILMGVLAGCGGASADASCDAAFEATVKTGPDTDTLLFGQLHLDQLSDTTWSGYLDPYTASDAGPVPPTQITEKVTVTGTTAGDSITLTFALADGRKMTGTGQVPSGQSLCTASGKVTGDLTGPAAGDTGDWVISVKELVCQSTGGNMICISGNKGL
jgi:hypothetical protein